MVNEFIYDAEKHIDIEYIESILQKNEGKEIICFGGGTAADILMRKLLHKYNVVCFLDNNKKLQGDLLFKIGIQSPEILAHKQRGTYIVLILSKHVNAISQQLKEFGLDETDYYDIYNKFISYFRIKKYEKNAYDFINFIERIPDGYFDDIPIKNENQIGIVCFGEMIKNLTWYSMAQSLVLRQFGYKSTLIIDTLRSFDSHIYFDGIEAIARIYIEYVVKVLQMKCKDIKVTYIEESKCAALEKDDIDMSEKYAPLVVKWFDSRRDEVFLPNDKNRIQIAQMLLKDTMKHIKAFFNENKFDTINVYTGIHRHRCVYTHLGQRMGWRVSTYDGDESGLVLYETDGVSGHSYDILRLIKGTEFGDDERDKIIEIAKKDFVSRMNARNAAADCRDDRCENMKSYDVVIPLNISWDSAALAKDNLFDSEIEWIFNTVEYIMNHSDASVMIREHPDQSKFIDYNYINYLEKISTLKNYGDRIYYADSLAKVSIYQYVEKCKIVLPYSSTAGVEAAILKKNVILHTNVYYDDIGIAYKATNREDYYRSIKKCLENESIDYVSNVNNAYLAYYFQMKHTFQTIFSECFSEWMQMEMNELCQVEGIDKIVGVIAKNETAIYTNVYNELIK